MSAVNTQQTEKYFTGRKFIASLCFLFGLILVPSGIYLGTLGGSLYYALLGFGLLLSGWLQWRSNPLGAGLYLLLLVCTLVWSYAEVGFNGWALLPRTALLTTIGLCIAFLWRKSIPRSVLITTVLTIIIFYAVVLTPSASIELPENEKTTPQVNLAVGNDWPFVGGTGDAQRFSPLVQITPENISNLEVVWKVHLGMPGPDVSGTLQVTPLKIDNTLYACNSEHVVIALDPETGDERWRYDPKSDSEGSIISTCRGVAYHKAPHSTGLCSERIISFARFGRMIALDAESGTPCPDFGENGEVDLLEGMGPVEKGYYFHNSAATIVRGNIIVGGAVLDGQELGEPSGVIRAYDVITGKFAWAWDMGRPGDHGMPPEGEFFTRGTPNSWAPKTADEELELVYVPLGNATPDYLAAHRSPVMEEFNDAIIALDAETGELRWSFQTTHRDVWDYDVASPPTLIDFPTDDGSIPALIQATKRNQFFVLDRRTGEPLIDIEERPVPQNAVPGEVLSPTQPYAVGMPSFYKPLKEEDMWGLTPFDQLWCRIKFHESVYEGDFTPFHTEPTLIYPGYLGGSNWYGISVDPERQIMLLNINHFVMRNQLVPRAEADLLDIRPMRVGSVPFNLSNWPQAGLEYSAKTKGFLSPLETPCFQPPYSEIAAVDLTTRKIIWKKPLGTGRDTGPFGIPSMLPVTMGVPALGGILVTRSGLIFIAATQEKTFRAIDSRTGELLWQDRLAAGGHANPMTYYSEKSGRQFVVIPASGHPLMNNSKADYLVAYALPKDAVSAQPDHE